VNPRIALIRQGARTRFARPTEWVGALAAGAIICATTRSIWLAASADPTVATQAVIGWIAAASVAGRTDEWLATRWSDGGLAIDLARPIGLGEQVLLRDLGRAGIGLLAVGMPLAVVFASPPANLAFLGGLAVAALAGHAFGLLSGVLTIALGAPAGTTWVRASILALLSGAAVPAAALEGPFRAFVLYGPFGAIAACPAALWSGHPPWLVAVHAAWALGWTALAHASLARAGDQLGATGG
jgi:hypothetical protein